MAQYLEARGSHPRKKPRIDLPLSLRGLQQVFSHSADFQTRRVRVLGDGERTVTVCYLLGVVRTERLNDYVLRPLAQDGVLAGCNVELYRTLKQACNLQIVASGGVSSLEDVRALAGMSLYAAIIGKAYYEGKINLTEAIRVAKGEKGDGNAC